MLLELLGRRPSLRITAVGARLGFRTWRGERPFWAGLFTVAAGLPIVYFPYVHLSLSGIPLALSTTAGAGSLLIGVLLVVLGFTLWFHHQVRVFAGIAVMLLALVSFPVSNFGGLFLGLFSGLIGGALACAWVPPPATAEPRPAMNRASSVTAPTGGDQGEN
ncbi:DUF6114 domain-containing protein [Streptomyces sp. NPDC054841]